MLSRRAYDALIALGGPLHGERLRIPVEWDVLPSFAGDYRRVALPSGDGHALLHDSVAREHVLGLMRWVEREAGGLASGASTA